MHPPRRILVVEDDSTIAKRVYEGLRDHGFDVELAMDGQRAIELLHAHTFDLLVLDLQLPERSGFDVLKSLQNRPVPTIVLTAMSDLPTRLKSFELGAVDYLQKPFWIEELLVRIQTRLRIHDETPGEVLEWADARYDVQAQEVVVAGTPVSLTPHERSVLSFLVGRPGRAVSRLQIIEGALPETDCTERTIDSHITRLRRKLGAGGAAIRTIRGVGYRFAPE